MLYLGLDLGKLRDFTALAIVEPLPYDELAVRYLERAPLGTPYLRVVQRVTDLSRDPILNGRCHLVMDGSGVGNPIEEALRTAQGGWRGLTAVTITAGDRARQSTGTYGIGDRWNVPRRDLLSGLQILLEKGKLKIAAEMPETRALVRELIRLRRPSSRRGPQGLTDPDTDGREEHDDLVMAVALACWQASRTKIGLGMNRLI